MSDLARISVSPGSHTTTIRVVGEIDLSNADWLLDAITEATPTDAIRMVLDLTHTTYLDSTGIAMLFHLAERLTHRRQELRVVVPPEARIRAVITLTGVQAVIAIHDSPEDASA